MKIMLTGGGNSGGHFYPIIAISRELKRIAEEKRIVTIDLVFAGDTSVDPEALYTENIRTYTFASGKMRRYASLLNITDIFKTIAAIIRALGFVYKEMPDAVFSKGGHASLPIVIAARLYGIPILIHESDAIPGRSNAWAGRFAQRVAVSFPNTMPYFPKQHTVLTGVPIQKRILGGNPAEAQELFRLEPDIPTVLFLGGSQGALPISEVFLEILPSMVDTYQIVHQCGKKNFKDISGRASVILEGAKNKHRYHPYAMLTVDQLRSISSTTHLVVSRAGGSTIFEIAAWGIPSILIPLSHAAQDHQRANAYAYARAGGCLVIEEANLTPTVLLAAIRKLLSDTAKREEMKAGAQKFAKLDAAEKIARELIKLGLHEGE